MHASPAVKEFFATRERTNVLATTGKDCKVNVAAFGSPTLLDDSTVAMMLGENRTWQNLKENGKAALLVILHGGTGMGMKGCRLYLSFREAHDSGEKFDAMITPIRERIGKGADILKHYVEFDITEARPILDFGQGV